MKKSADDLARIALAGGGFTISATDYSVADLSRIALAASNHRARIHITDANGLDTNDLSRIALAGQGAVSFDLS